VTGLQPGQRVMGLFASGTGPVAVTDARLVVPVPDSWTFAQAAAAPVAYLTAYYGLRDLGGLQPGESVLIHAATGGVGQAALQLARHWGATAYATASPPKWPVLHQHGLPASRIASSRDAGFEDHFRAAAPAGIDVILDCLAGELVDASLRLLAPAGRFLEMGKTDIRDPADVTCAHPGRSYQAFDVLDAGEDRVAEILADLHALFTAGDLHPLPVTATDIGNARPALRHLSQARHTGKLVLTLPAPPPDPDGTVLITGGTGTLGGLTARHLITRHHIRHLLLISRQGPRAPGAGDLAADLTALGAHVTITACDTADPAQLAATLAAIPPDHPLTGVIHTAGTLADATIPAQDPARLDTVLAPKITAAWNLHHQTATTPLAWFIMYSSIAGTLGSPGQANYAAANAALDALAAWRRARGLPATSLAWGYWDTPTGISAHLTPADHARIARTLTPMPPSHAMDLLDTALASPHPDLIPATLNTATLRTRPRDTLPPLLRNLTTPAPARTATPATTLTATLAPLTPAQQHDRLLALIRTHAAAVLGHPTPDTIPPATAFKDLGFDSLTAIELRNRLTTATSLPLPTTLIFDHPTPETLSTHIGEQILSAGKTALSDSLCLGELEKLANGPLADSIRKSLAVRLRGILAQVENDNVTAEASAPVRNAIKSATDDELFDLIEKGF
jgi:NADPH:quinone reductase-like Zn-dependent oxidoreductase/NAD(P)-dependent dehydrogenase (short-subunit alcohol dehydrogenase family)/acyl carrier protein